MIRDEMIDVYICTILYTILQYIILYYTILYYTIHIILYYTILYYGITIPYNIPTPTASQSIKSTSCLSESLGFVFKSMLAGWKSP